MSTIRATLDPTAPTSPTPGRIDFARVDATTEEEIAAREAADDAAAIQDAAKFARRARRGAWA